MKIIVIGGGPAGMMAAGAAAQQGASVTLLEKNEKLGKKLYITGKGRCNLTNDTDVQGLMGNIVTNPRFMHSAFYSMDSQGLMAFIESLGVPLKTERGGRVFPVSDKANDINAALEVYLRRVGVTVQLNCVVEKIELTAEGRNLHVVGAGSSRPSLPEENDFDHTCQPFTMDISCGRENPAPTTCKAASCGTPPTFTIHTNKGDYNTDAIIIATGGLSYPSTGSTGDGYTFAKNLGHNLIPTHPSLVPLHAIEPWIPDLAGLSLKNVKLTTRVVGRIVYEALGEMLFTPHGITGPLALSASAYLAGKDLQNTLITIDLKPALSPEQLDARLLRDFEEHKNKDFVNALGGLLPQRLIKTIIELSQIPPYTKVHTITRTQRTQLAALLKNLEIRVNRNAGYKEAVITKGGVSTKEVNPSTLMSKHVPGLFFAGEVLDVDALTGGYNMQIAFSTGHLAGLSAAEYVAQ